tara:strand:- start:988 stop:2073 length:1086 start_codon:yes stop_codon:yes gene_type:complete
MPIVDLNYRKNQTAALTSTQVDRNFELVQDFTNGLETLYNTAFNQDGTFKVPVTATNIQSDSHFYAEDTSSNDDYAITLSPAITAYKDGMVVAFKAKTTNTGAASLNVNSVGAKSIFKRKDIPLEDGDIVAGQIVEARYNSTTDGFEVTTPLSNQLGLKTGTKGQKIRVDNEGKIEFYTPTIAAAEFTGHVAPYWGAIQGGNLYGTDKEDTNVSTNLQSGGSSVYDDIDVLKLHELSNQGGDYPIYVQENKNVELKFDDDKLNTAGGGVKIAETSGLNILVQGQGGDRFHGMLNIWNPNTLKYAPLYMFEVGNWENTGYQSVHTMITCPRMDSNEYKFKLICQNVSSASLSFIGFKIIGHY